MYKNYLKLN